MRYFVSGHLNLLTDEFEAQYVPTLEQVLASDPEATFVIGDARGADAMAVAWLLNRPIDPSRLTVYHLYVLPRLILPEGARTHGRFRRDAERDEAMTRASDVDIAWVRPEEETQRLLGAAYRPGRISGTQHNLDRRTRMAKEN